jgi:hypothetical protein
MPVKLRVVERASKADRVLSSCRSGSVCCWSPSNHGLEIAVFLQYHGDDGDFDATEGPQAALRFAYRNYRPVTAEFTRVHRTVGGQLDSFEPDERLEILRARDDRYMESILPAAVGVRRTAPTTHVGTTLSFHTPDVLAREGEIGELIVNFPDEGKAAKCPCCSRVFHT